MMHNRLTAFLQLRHAPLYQAPQGGAQRNPPLRLPLPLENALVFQELHLAVGESERRRARLQETAHQLHPHLLLHLARHRAQLRHQFLLPILLHLLVNDLASTCNLKAKHASTPARHHKLARRQADRHPLPTVTGTRMASRLWLLSRRLVLTDLLE